MLREFVVNNFMSFRNETIVSFISKKKRDIVSSIKGKEYINKLGLLYGSNASGKSNLLKAISTIFKILSGSYSPTQTEVWGYMPFALDYGKPITLKASFYKEETRYDYAVTYERYAILSEDLYYYPNGKRVLFYNRRHTKEGENPKIMFGSSLSLNEEIKEKISDYTLINRSVLSVVTTNTFPVAIKPFLSLHDWLKSYASLVESSRLDTYHIHQLLKEIQGSPKKYSFFTELLHKADFNIVDFNTVAVNNSEEEQVPQTFFKVHSNERDFELSLDLQSQGTLQFLSLTEFLYNLIYKETLICIDELGEDLHFELLYYYLMCFLYNSRNSQLLLTSQEVSILQDPFFNDNRQLIWLIEKDKDTAVSDCSRGDDFELAKDKSFYNFYMRGRLGAKPETGSFFLSMKEDEEA